MTTATLAISLFLLVLFFAFILGFIYFAAESIPSEGYAPDPDEGLLKSVVTKIFTVELVTCILSIPPAFKPPAVQNLKLIDAGHADMTNYWVAVVIIMLLTPILIPPIYWGMYWVLVGVCWLFKALYAALTGFIEWWGGIIFRGNK